MASGRDGRPWRTVSAQVYSEETHCWLCGRYVDQRLPATHRMSRSADHLIQLQHGGPPSERTNLRLAHLGCNSARGNRLRHIPKQRCACITGRPCGVLNPRRPRGYVAVDAGQV
jgi:5-methylcytosine-specific restriction endonuclease McrA